MSLITQQVIKTLSYIMNGEKRKPWLKIVPAAAVRQAYGRVLFIISGCKAQLDGHHIFIVRKLYLTIRLWILNRVV